MQIDVVFRCNSVESLGSLIILSGQVPGVKFIKTEGGTPETDAPPEAKPPTQITSATGSGNPAKNKTSRKKKGIRGRAIMNKLHRTFPNGFTLQQGRDAFVEGGLTKHAFNHWRRKDSIVSKKGTDGLLHVNSRAKVPQIETTAAQILPGTEGQIHRMNEAA